MTFHSDFSRLWKVFGSQGSCAGGLAEPLASAAQLLLDPAPFDVHPHRMKARISLLKSFFFIDFH